MRSSIADYEVLEVLRGTGDGRVRYLCRPPTRLAGEDPLEVTEVGVDGDRWPQWSDQMIRVAAVASPDLRTLIEIGADPGGAGAWFSIEAAPGGSLGNPRRLGPEGASGGRSRLDAVATAARAVHALHEAGLAHGSVSPATIVFSGRGPVLDPPVLDGPEGLAAGASGGRPLSAVDPDLLRGQLPSRVSDVWSLGASLHLALSERPLYPGIDSDQAVTAVQRVMFTRPEIDPDLAPDVRDLIERCLTPDPAGRPETADEVARALAELEVER